MFGSAMNTPTRWAVLGSMPVRSNAVAKTYCPAGSTSVPVRVGPMNAESACGVAGFRS